MSLLNSIILPFQAGFENIITASGKTRELSVIKRIFEDNRYTYHLQSDTSPFSWQGRVSMFIKGIALCFPLIGHITSVALRCFSSSIFPEMPLDFAIKCSSKQKLAIAKQFYIDRTEGVNKTTRLELAKILVDDERGLHLLAANFSYLDLTEDVDFSLKIIQQKPELIKNPQFTEEFLNLLEKCSSEQKLAIAKLIFINEPEWVNETTRLKLAKILADDEEGLHLLAANFSYLALMEDVDFSLEIIQKKPELLDQINDLQFAEQLLDLLRECSSEQKLTTVKLILTNKLDRINNVTHLGLAEILAHDLVTISSTNTELSKKYKHLFVKQILQTPPTDCRFITTYFDNLKLNEALEKVFIKELILQTKEVELSHQMQAAIIYVLKNRTNIDFIEHLLKDADINIALANILLSSEEGCNYVVTHIRSINLLQNMDFTQKLFQENPIPEQIKQHFAEQILQENPTNRKFIIDLFHSLKFSMATQEEVIEQLLHKMDSSSDQMQAAIAHTIIEKHPNGPSFLLNKIALFIHTPELADILLKIPGGNNYITNNSDQFAHLEEQENSALV